jgi:hypothetical protein
VRNGVDARNTSGQDEKEGEDGASLGVIARELAGIEKRTGRTEPTVII